MVHGTACEHAVLMPQQSCILRSVPVQELNDRRLTLVEGSALSERDLVRTRAHLGSAILLLADRFSPSSHQEDLGLQFQVSPFEQSISLSLTEAWNDDRSLEIAAMLCACLLSMSASISWLP